MNNNWSHVIPKNPPLVKPLTMRGRLEQADYIAISHQKGKITALVAESALMDLGFTEISFDKFGVKSAKYLDVSYSLGAL
jgi:hypothetical protein